MDNKGIVNNLDYIKKLIEEKNYDEAIKQLDNTKANIIFNENAVNEYMDNLIGQLN